MAPKSSGNVRAHLEWLGFVRPTGLVVSAPALDRAGAVRPRDRPRSHPRPRPRRRPHPPAERGAPKVRLPLHAAGAHRADRPRHPGADPRPAAPGDRGSRGKAARSGAARAFRPASAAGGSGRPGFVRPRRTAVRAATGTNPQAQGLRPRDGLRHLPGRSLPPARRRARGLLARPRRPARAPVRRGRDRPRPPPHRPQLPTASTAIPSPSTWPSSPCGSPRCRRISR